MTTTKTTAEYAAQLRALADIYDAEPDLPVPAYRMRITPSPATRESYLAVRRLFPDATVDDSDASSVDVEVDLDGLRVAFIFWKSDIGVRRTVTREVTEFVLDLELLPAVAS